MWITSFADGTEPSWTVIESMPNFYGLNVDAGIFVAEAASAVNGYAIENSSKRWSMGINRYYTAGMSCAGDTLVAVRRQPNTLVVVRMDTGEEVWRYDNRSMGMPDGGSFIGDTDWLELQYRCDYDEKGCHPQMCLLYAPDGNTFYRLPEKHQVAAIAPDEKIAFLRFEDKQGEAPGLTRISSLALDSGAITPGFTVESKDFEGIVGVLDSNESLVMKYRRQGEERVYSLVNARTGTLIHPITLPEKTLGGLKIFAEDKRWLFLSESKDILWIQDSATGEIRYTRHREGHVFFSLKGTDAEGQLWALSRDQNNSWWLWRADADTEPRLLLDATKYPYFAGMAGFGMYYGHIFEHNPAVDNSPLIARRLEDQTITNQWIIPGKKGFTLPIPSADLRRVLVGTGDSFNSMHFGVYESGQSTPLVESEGRPLAFSPDGLYAVVYQEDKELVLHVDSGAVVADIPLGEGCWPVQPAFSRDSRRLALCGQGQSLKIVVLEENYPVMDLHLPSEKERTAITARNGLCFSSDGKTLLAAAYGRAWLFNANTGAFLKTLIEHARFISGYPSSPSVLGIQMPWINSLKEFAGGFTDTFKNPPELAGSFILDGRTLVTSAEGHLLRVWDAKTGASLRTMETGLPESRDEQGYVFNDVVFSSNGVYAFAFNSAQGVASLLEVTTGRTLRQYKDDRTKCIYQAYVADDGEIYLLNAIGLCRLSLKK